METITKPESNKKEWKLKGWIAACAGAIILIVGSIGFIGDDSVNNVLVETGAAQMASGIVEEEPSSKEVILKIADALDAAAQARTVSPAELSRILNDLVQKHLGGFDTSNIISAIISQINKNYEVSKTEEEYVEKVRCMARGLRNGASCNAAELELPAVD